MLYQHGDLLIKSINDPLFKEKASGATRRQPVDGKLTLLEGELTGHAHVIEAVRGVEVIEIGSITFVVVPEGGATVSHEEHLPQLLPEGTYQLDQVQEFDPMKQVVRRVWD